VAALFSDSSARAHIGAEGRTFVDANRGALVKLMGLIVPLLEH
jgi:hypothetical protein